jgi:hypothetical protein
MAAFITRIVKTFVEDVLVQKISDHPAVQRMAVRAVDTQREAQRALESPNNAKQFFSEVWTELQKHAQRDLGSAPATRPEREQPRDPASREKLR